MATQRKTQNEESAESQTASTGLPADALSRDPEAADVQKAVKERLDKEMEAGVRGTPPDPTPNENYTVAGVTDDSKHVPEEFKTQTGVTVMPDVHEDAKS